MQFFQKLLGKQLNSKGITALSITSEGFALAISQYTENQKPILIHCEFTPVMESLEIEGKTITGDALLTQRKLARYLVEDCLAHYVFIAKDNQPTLAEDIRLAFENRQAPDYSEPYILAHGRLESRSIWTSTRLNDYLDFPFVGQIFAIQCHTTDKKTGKETKEIAYGLTSHSPESAGAERVLKFNREH